MKKVKILMGTFCVAIMALCSTTAHSASVPAGIAGNVTVTNPETNPVNVKVASDKESVVVDFKLNRRIFPDGSTEPFTIPAGKDFVLTDVVFSARRGLTDINLLIVQSMDITLDQAGDSRLEFFVVIPPNYTSESKTFSLNTGVRFAGPYFLGTGHGGTGTATSTILLLGYLTSEP
jgi:hypothetical protein